MVSVLTNSILFLTVIGLSKCDYDLDYTDTNPCNDFYESEDAGECHNSRLPGETFENIYGPNVRSCCPDHSYRFYDHCEASMDLQWAFNPI